MLDGGDALLIIGALLGHRSTKATERYAHLSGDPVKQAADRISSEIAELLGAQLVAADDKAFNLIDASPEDLAPVGPFFLGRFPVG
jgi:hypothetical protein